MRLDNIISDELQDQIAALSSFAFTTHIDVVMVSACSILHHCINSSCYDSLPLNLAQVCFSGDGNYAATITPANLERLFQAAVVEVRFFSALLLWTLLCATSYLWFFMFFLGAPCYYRSSAYKSCPSPADCTKVLVPRQGHPSLQRPLFFSCIYAITPMPVFNRFADSSSWSM
jgi:hypothetical protein